MPFFPQLNELLKVWTPWFAVFGVVWHAYRKFRNSIDQWAGKLLDNHLFHVQESLNNLNATHTQLLDTQKEQIELLTRIADK